MTRTLAGSAGYENPYAVPFDPSISVGGGRNLASTRTEVVIRPRHEKEIGPGGRPARAIEITSPNTSWVSPDVTKAQVSPICMKCLVVAAVAVAVLYLFAKGA